MSKPKRKPNYTLHKTTGQARVRLDGKDHYLGIYGSPESRERYDDLIADWYASRGNMANYSMSVGDLSLLFMKHATLHYRKNGRPTSEISCLKTAVRYLVALCGKTPIREFGPKSLKSVRQMMIDDQHCRTSINKHAGRIRRVFSWAVENEYCKPDILAGLQAVKGLQTLPESSTFATIFAPQERGQVNFAGTDRCWESAIDVIK